jgi:hypothetical protein
MICIVQDICQQYHFIRQMTHPIAIHYNFPHIQIRNDRIESKQINRYYNKKSIPRKRNALEKR